MAQACEDIGFAAASRGHTILIADNHSASIDFYIARGACRFASENPNSTVRIEINRPEGSNWNWDSLPSNVDIDEHYYTELDRAQHGTGTLIPNLAALDSSDILISIGGRLTAKLMGNIAADRDKPVLAIPAFGGTSAELYDRLKYLYKSSLEGVKKDFSAIQTVWGSCSAGSIINVAEALANRKRIISPSSYFISYTWAESEYADHVEVLLHRKNRAVNRDESIFEAGSDLSDVVKSLIQESDTFIGLWSAKYEKSTWCPQELEYAMNCMTKGEKPSRVVLICLDDTEPPIRFTGKLRLQGNAREHRDLSIRKLIEEEQE